MTETELAIEHFSYGISHDIYSEPVTTYAGLAVEALREKQERDKVCEYCEDHTPNDSQFYDAEGELGAKFLYCPMCGKRLEVKHETD